MVERILDTAELPDPPDQVDNLIMWLGENVEPGRSVSLDKNALIAEIGAADEEGLDFILHHIMSDGIWGQFSGRAHNTLSVKGWNRFADLKRRSSESRKVFMAMPFGDTEINKMFRDCFKPAVSQAGFELLRVDEEPSAGSIDNRIRLMIRTSRFLIADLTNSNRGAYWEAGFAEGLGKPVIYTCRKSYFDEMGTHFDTRNFQTVLWEASNVSAAIENLKTTVRVTLPSEAVMIDPLAVTVPPA